MPAKNSTKLYAEDSYYHIYNRGVEKRTIFLDEQDYNVFLSYLGQYLTPKNEESLKERLSNPETTYKEREIILRLLRLKNYSEEISLLAYCLMPNHFHFFIRQKNNNSINNFIQSLATRYTMYFNRKYKRVGPLYQGVYKAVLISTDEQFLHLSRYIHKQAIATKGDTLRAWAQPSSYPKYLENKTTSWVKPEEVLSFFSKTNKNFSYKAFVEAVEEEPEFVSNFALED